jgi:hypothetical protein
MQGSLIGKDGEMVRIQGYSYIITCGTDSFFYMGNKTGLKEALRRADALSPGSKVRYKSV